MYYLLKLSHLESLTKVNNTIKPRLSGTRSSRISAHQETRRKQIYFKVAVPLVSVRALYVLVSSTIIFGSAQHSGDPTVLKSAGLGVVLALALAHV